MPKSSLLLLKWGLTSHSSVIPDAKKALTPTCNIMLLPSPTNIPCTPPDPKDLAAICNSA